MDLRFNSVDMAYDEIKARIARLPLSQEQIALKAGYEPSLLSRILRGLRPEPADFERRVTAALDRLERAEQAAEPAPSVELQLWRLDTPPVAASANVILVASTGGQLIPRHASSDDTRVTLAPSRYADYELRARLTAAPSDPTTTARVWAAEIVETEAL